MRKQWEGRLIPNGKKGKEIESTLDYDDDLNTNANYVEDVEEGMMSMNAFPKDIDSALPEDFSFMQPLVDWYEKEQQQTAEGHFA